VIVFKSNRSFIVVSFAASHGLLLLRSNKTMSISTRMDVLIQDVRAAELRFWFDGITIELANQELLQGHGSVPNDLLEPGNQVYSLLGNGWTGFILGGILTTLEDSKDNLAPSGLLA